MSPEPAVRPRPTIERDSAAWWAALGRHEFSLPRCDECGAWRWPPRDICNHCGSTSWTMTPVSRRGTIASWIVNHHRFSAAFNSPYVVVMVRLDEQDDVVMPGAWFGPEDGSGLAVGIPVVAGYLDVTVDEGTEPVTLLQWRLASEPDTLDLEERS